jgi:hypothetical protein
MSDSAPTNPNVKANLLRQYRGYRQQDQYRGYHQQDAAKGADTNSLISGITDVTLPTTTTMTVHTDEEVLLGRLWCANVMIELLRTEEKSSTLANMGNPVTKNALGISLKPAGLGKSRKLREFLHLEPRLSCDNNIQHPRIFLSGLSTPSSPPSRSASSVSKDKSSGSDGFGSGLELDSSSPVGAAAGSSGLVVAEEPGPAATAPPSVWLTPPEYREKSAKDMNGKPYRLVAPLELKQKDYVRRLNDLVRDGICHLVTLLVLRDSSDSGSAAAPKITNLMDALTWLRDHPSVLEGNLSIEDGSLSKLEEGCFMLVENKYEANIPRLDVLFEAARSVLEAFAPMSRANLQGARGFDSVHNAQDQLLSLQMQFRFHEKYRKHRNKEISKAPVPANPTVLHFTQAEVIRESELELRAEVYALATAIKAAADEVAGASTFELPTEISLPDEAGTETRTVAVPEQLRVDPFLPGLLLVEALRIQQLTLDEVASKLNVVLAGRPAKTLDRADLLAQCTVDARVLERVVVEPGESDDTITLCFHYAGDFADFCKEVPEKQRAFITNVMSRLGEVTGMPMSLQLINPGGRVGGVRVTEGSIQIVILELCVEAYRAYYDGDVAPLGGKIVEHCLRSAPIRQFFYTIVEKCGPKAIFEACTKREAESCWALLAVACLSMMLVCEKAGVKVVGGV